MEIYPFYVTFGVQYGRRPGDDMHNLAMYADGYAVFEAPSYEIAHALAAAVYGTQWAFIYTEADFQPEYHPAGELMRLSWTWKAVS
jgi:hypothetical protein